MATTVPKIDFAVPDHVPPEFVRMIDLTTSEGMDRCPHAMMGQWQEGPRLFFTPIAQNPDGGFGFWVPTRAEDIRRVLQETDTFSARQIARFSSLIGESWDLIPAEIDPPAHGKYRKPLNPLFGPSAISAVTASIRQHAISLIEPLKHSDGCEFVASFAQPFPILIFLSIIGLPLDRFPDILAWGHQLHEGTSIQERITGATAIGVFLREEIEKARAAPRDDVLSAIVHLQIDGRTATDDEIIGMVYLIFTGGIHTVTATLGFAAQHLARNPALQTRLRETPGDIPAAIDEMMRAYSVVHSYRRVVKDVDLGGVHLKAGDWVLAALPVANLDKCEFANADIVDIDRKPNRHMGFSFGTHFCLGAHLARTEMRIAWEEWFLRIPEFRVREEATKVTSGGLLGVNHLELQWV